MLLIADSGSTSTTWVLMDGQRLCWRVKTEGLNPYHVSAQQFSQVLAELIVRQEIREMDSIYFYGSGCTSKKRTQVFDQLSNAFPMAQNIVVETDLLGAAVSLLGEKAGIACILGTGSNSCLFDGTQIVQNVCAGGYILGDEGSGAVLGRHLMTAYIKGLLPLTLKEALESDYEISVDHVVERIYNHEGANRYLAEFTPFLKKHLAEPFIYNLIFDQFTLFLKNNVLAYAGYEEAHLSFTGSVSYVFKEVLKIAAEELELEIERVIADPMDGLIEFFRKKAID